MTPAPTTISFFGRLSQTKRAGRGDDRLLVDLDAGQARDVGAGGDDDRLRLKRVLVSVLALDHDLTRRGDAALALDPIDLVLLEQKGDAVDVGGDGVVLVLHHRHQIELGRGHNDAERAEVVSASSNISEA